MENRVYIETWGCQMNLHQSEGIAGVMASAGYALVDRLEDADVVLFNGCMVRQKAEEKLLGRIGAVVEQKRGRRILFGVGGCFGEVHGAGVLKRCGSVDFVFGSSGHASLPALIARARESERGVFVVRGQSEVDETPFRRLGRASAMVTITEGCSNFCSYCIVPYARGPMRSRAPDQIVSEIRDAARQGYREVVLLGQNVNAYGIDRVEYGGFASLLNRIAAEPIDRIRFTSSHPRDMNVDLLETMAAHPSICSHLHLACQSGSDRILGEMNRGYSRALYLEIVDQARRLIPGLNVTTDIIVGYPGESRDEFEETLELIREVRFGSIFVAKYSPRPLTRAAQKPDDVPTREKEERLQRILELQRRIALEGNEAFVGEQVEVLIEGRTRDGAHYGRADDHRTVVVQGSTAPGDLITVGIEGASPAALSGIVLVPEGAVS
jgi:tRNA-2-methylthio-N6-dimethylallyladenosine synthase